MKRLEFLNGNRILSPLPARRVLARYLIGLATGILAIALRALLDPILRHEASFVTIYIAVAYSALVCGLLPATVSGVVGFFGVFYWFVDPRHSLRSAMSEGSHATIGFILVCAVLIALGVANRQKHLARNKAIRVLELEAEQRRKAEGELLEVQKGLEFEVSKRTEALVKINQKLEWEVRVRKEQEAQLRRLSIGLISAQDEERRRIARELHDSCGQTLAAAKMSLAGCQESFQDLSRLQNLLEDVDVLLTHAVTEIRTTSYLLHPPLLEEAGISSAAKWYVDGFSRRSRIQVTCSFPDERLDLPRNYELVMFRVLQEGLTNIHRHSGASEVKVAVVIEPTCITLRISDNGSGMNEAGLARLNEDGSSAGVGLVGMRERLTELGGRLEFESNGSGTTLTAVFPVMKPVPASAGIDKRRGPARIA